LTAPRSVKTNAEFSSIFPVDRRHFETTVRRTTIAANCCRRLFTQRFATRLTVSAIQKPNEVYCRRIGRVRREYSIYIVRSTCYENGHGDILIVRRPERFASIIFSPRDAPSGYFGKARWRGGESATIFGPSKTDERNVRRQRRRTERMSRNEKRDRGTMDTTHTSSGREPPKIKFDKELLRGKNRSALLLGHVRTHARKQRIIRRERGLLFTRTRFTG